MESSSLAETTKSFISSLRSLEYENLALGFAGTNNWHMKLPLTLALGFVTYIFLWHIRRSRRMNLPPSPPSWPIIGHMHLLGPQLHQSLAHLANKYGPIMLLRFGAKATLVISSPDMAREIFKEHDLVFSQRPQTVFLDIFNIARRGLAFQDNNAMWRNLRKIFMMELMAPERLKSVVQIRADEITFMLRCISRGIINSGTTDTPQEIKTLLWIYTSNLASQMMLSKRYFLHESSEESDEAKEFRRFMDTFNRLAGTVFPAEILSFLRWFDIGGLQHQAKACLPWFESIAGKILAERREKRKLNGGKPHVDSDMLDVLLTHQEKEARDEGGITDANIGSVIWDVFGAGTDTAMITIEWTLAHLVTDSRVMKKLQSEIDNASGTPKFHSRVSQSDLPKLPYLLAVVKEALRLHPPSPLLLPHYSHKACNVAGYHVPANTQLFVNVWAISHDERNWEKPNEFFPERFMDSNTPLPKLDVPGQNFQFLPFGSGRRGCPAVSLALVNVQMVVGSLVQAFEWSLPEGMEPVDFDMSEGAGFLCSRATKFRAVPKHRLPTSLY